MGKAILHHRPAPALIFINCDPLLTVQVGNCGASSSYPLTWFSPSVPAPLHFIRRCISPFCYVRKTGSVLNMARPSRLRFLRIGDRHRAMGIATPKVHGYKVLRRAAYSRVKLSGLMRAATVTMFSFSSSAILVPGRLDGSWPALKTNFSWNSAVANTFAVSV
jgi:hypothetical protein